MSADHLTLPIAFVAGLLSFVSPCVLPLVPAYLGYLSGAALGTGEGPAARKALAGPFLHAVMFVVGFSVVFVSLGASATLLGQLLFGYRTVMARAGGVLLVAFGMRLMGSSWRRRTWIAAAGLAALVTFVAASGLLTQGRIAGGSELATALAESAGMSLVVLAGAGYGRVWPLILGVGVGVLNYLSSPSEPVARIAESLLVAAITVLSSRADLFYAERRLQVAPSNRSGLARSMGIGVVFAAGWTPCLGPILAAILGLASQLDTVGQGVLLLIAYSLGLGIPFLIVGLAWGPFSKALRRLNRYLGIVSIVSGVLLIVMGILFYTDSLAFLAQYGNLIELKF